MLGGIVFQMGERCSLGFLLHQALTYSWLATITFYAIFAGEFFLRYSKKWPVRPSANSSGTPKAAVMDNRLKLMVYALFFETTCLFIR